VIVGEYDGDMIVNDVVLVEIKIAPQYDKRDEAQLLNVLKATGTRAWRSTQLWPAQDRIQNGSSSSVAIGD
jgi:hypothetical protein